jgi:branched-subunit amino acid aminotransferase/4-amino-4-deoxychorismate lyase
MYWYNGELIEDERISLSIDDVGLLYGATLFTTLRIYQNSLEHPLTHWQEHLERLHSSLRFLSWSCPDWERIRRGAEKLLLFYPVLRITIFPDGREWIKGRFLPVDLDLRQEQGIIGWVADNPPWQRSLGEHKTGNYLAPWLAAQIAQKKGAKEAILVDRVGNWLETSTGNLWGWKDNCWYTPRLWGDILPGIGRSNLIQWLKQKNISVQENLWTSEFVQTLPAIAYSNSVVEVIPFNSILGLDIQINPAISQQVLPDLQQYFLVLR